MAILLSIPGLRGAVSRVTVDAGRPLATVPAGLYGVGYNGWGDITDPEAIRALQDIQIRLQYLMETVPKYAEWCRSLRACLDDRQGNPSGKRIGVAYSEFDALAASPYQHSPENPDWPAYRKDADCYLNTNYFGGVWCAAVLCDLAASGACDIACKFNTRQFYGLIDNRPGGPGYFRQPVWFAWKLLQDVAQLRAGATLLGSTVSGPTDSAKAHVGGKDSPWVCAYAVATAAAPRLILINRSLEPQRVEVQVSGLTTQPGDQPVHRYRYDESRVARFIGRQPGSPREGQFEGVPDDTANARCLEVLDTLSGRLTGQGLSITDLQCPPLSITVLVPEPAAPGGAP